MLADTGFSFRGSSHGVEQSLSHQVWHQRHWATNAQGYRDFDSERLTDEPAILCIGDSYTAGYGIQDTADRYSNLLQRAFPEKREYNLGVPGKGISQQLTILQDFVKPGDIVVWQYFGDDIIGDDSVVTELMKDSLLMSTFMKSVDPLGRQSLIWQIPVRTSFLLNYIYWNKIHPIVETGLTDVLREIYGNDNYFSIHKRQISRFIQSCRERNAELVTIFMPLLMNEQLSNEIYEDRVADYLSKEGVTILRVSRISCHFPVAEKVVNKMDAHANEKLNAIIARELIKCIKELNNAKAD